MSSTLWRRRSVLVFFLIGFGIPWLGWTSLALSGLKLPSPAARALFYTGDFMTIAGFVATFVAAGASGFKSLLRRYFQMPAAVPWALFAWFLPCVWVGSATIVYGLTHGGIGRIDPAGLLRYFAPGVLLRFTTGPLGEEAGWRGFLLPRLLRHYSPLGASLILGLIWSVWHYALYYNTVFGRGDSAARFTLMVLCLSLLHTVLWAFTRGSVFWAIILHQGGNVTSSVVSAVFPEIHVPDGATAWLEAAITVGVTIATVLLVGRGRLKQKLGEVLDGLGAEAIESDRGRSS